MVESPFAAVRALALEEEAREAQAGYVAARARRRAAILAAVDGGVSYRRVAGWIGCDHTLVFQFVGQAQRAVEARAEETKP